MQLSILWIACARPVPPTTVDTGSGASPTATGDTGTVTTSSPTTTGDTGSDTGTLPPSGIGFDAPQILHTGADGAYVHDVFVADVDGDGDPDVLSSAYPGELAWHERLGDGTFGARHVVSGDGRGRIHAADLDGDGDVDVLDAAGTWYENQGTGDFVARDVTSDDIGCEHVTAADLDGDGDLDPLYAEYWEPPVYYYPNEGGTFGPRVVVPTPLGPEVRALVALAVDVEGDGDLDVVSYTEGDYGAGGAAVSLNDGSGSFGAAAGIDSPMMNDAADLDGDGDPDLVAGGWWVENVGGAFGVPLEIDADRRGPAMAVDLDGDGVLEVVAGGRYEAVAWYAGSGASWTGSDVSGVLPGGIEVAAADLDGDGCVDLLSAASGESGTAPTELAWYRSTACGL
jgi:hypothetical protein